MPCGTPDNTSASVDWVPSNKADSFLWLKNDSIQHRVDSQTHSSLAYVVGDDVALYRMPWQSQEG